MSRPLIPPCDPGEEKKFFFLGQVVHVATLRIVHVSNTRAQLPRGWPVSKKKFFFSSSKCAKFFSA